MTFTVQCLCHPCTHFHCETALLGEHGAAARALISAVREDREVLFCAGHQEILGIRKQQSSSVASSTIETILEFGLEYMLTPKKPHALSFVVKL